MDIKRGHRVYEQYGSARRMGVVFGFTPIGRLHVAWRGVLKDGQYTEYDRPRRGIVAPNAVSTAKPDVEGWPV